MGIGLSPRTFVQDAERAVSAMPDVAEAVYVGPQYSYDDPEAPGWPTGYVGARWMFVQGERYVAFIEPDHVAMLDNDYRLHRAEQVEHAFTQQGGGLMERMVGVPLPSGVPSVSVAEEPRETLAARIAAAAFSIAIVDGESDA